MASEREIEAAARVLWEHDYDATEYPWQDEQERTEYLTVARAVLEAAERVRGDGWRTIDSAPNEKVLLYSPPESLSDHPDQECDIRASRPADFCWATHWQPLPPPPKEGT